MQDTRHVLYYTQRKTRMFDKIFKSKSKQKMWDILQDKPPSIEKLAEAMMDGNFEKADEIFEKILEARMSEEQNK